MMKTLRQFVAVVFVSILASGTAPARDGIVEINGVVQSMPASGLIGSWTIAGTMLRTDASTTFEQQLGPLTVGAIVEAKATAGGGGQLVAQRIEVKQPASNPAASPVAQGEVVGAIESLPQGTLLGTWRVAGRTIVVVSATQIDQEHGGVAIGATVEAHGMVGSDGAITADRVEVLASTAAPPVTANAGAEDILGNVETLPTGGFVGIWQIAGIAIEVDASTVLSVEHGPIVVGALVEVHVDATGSGALRATRIETKQGQGAPVAPGRFWGTVTQLPGSTLTGLWKVDATIVGVHAGTHLRVEAGPFAIGAVVEVSGWMQSDGVVVAREIATRAGIGIIPGQSGRAVEFRNDRLQHFFVSASSDEIAALDAGAFAGEWRRTGENFGVGGTQAVCRFYGMPPRGPDSHFFTASAAECEHVMGEYAAWTFESHAFAIAVPDAAGQCAAGLVPVHRFYNQPQRGEDMNHRYVVTARAYADTVAMGWVYEGVVMCARP